MKRAMNHIQHVVELADVSFAYPGQAAGTVLDEVSLAIEPGDFIGLIGPNGGGKTTLLKVLLGLLRPQQGRVRVFDKRPEEVRDRIGYVPASGVAHLPKRVTRFSDFASSENSTESRFAANVRLSRQ